MRHSWKVSLSPFSPSPSTLMQDSLGPIKGHLEDPKSSTKVHQDEDEDHQI